MRLIEGACNFYCQSNCTCFRGLVMDCRARVKEALDNNPIKTEIPEEMRKLLAGDLDYFTPSLALVPSISQRISLAEGLDLTTLFLYDSYNNIATPLLICRAGRKKHALSPDDKRLQHSCNGFEEQGDIKKWATLMYQYSTFKNKA